MKTKAAVSCVLVPHPGLFANLIVKRCLKPISSESSLQGCFMLYQIDIVHKMGLSVVFSEPYAFLMRGSFLE